MSETPDKSGADRPAATIDASPGGPQAAPVRFPELRGAPGEASEQAQLDRIFDLSVPVTVELGRTTLSVQDLLQLGPGAVVELERSADAPVELFVHGKCVARGQIVVVDGYYGIRITSLRD
jgi:flagellar motor switch protein FliN